MQITGWLKSKHTFSFGHYYDPSRVNFGVLRVINDDFVEGGMGFGTHPHNNMEIISIPLSGDLAHKNATLCKNFCALTIKTHFSDKKSSLDIILTRIFLFMLHLGDR